MRLLATALCCLGLVMAITSMVILLAVIAYHETTCVKHPKQIHVDQQCTDYNLTTPGQPWSGTGTPLKVCVPEHTETVYVCED